MMTQCPECGSNDIVPDLNILTEETTSGHRPVYVKLMEPPPTKRPLMWIAQEVKTEFQASICGACGYTQFHAKHPAGILEAYQKGFVGDS